MKIELIRINLESNVTLKQTLAGLKIKLLMLN